MKNNPLPQSPEANVQPKTTDANAPFGSKIEFRYKNSFIDAELCEAVKPQAESIDAQLKDMSKGDKKLGSLLIALRTHFETFQVLRKTTKDTAEEAYIEYVQITFGISRSRALEYMDVAFHTELSELNLPISKLVEISRLSKKEVASLLKKYPENELAAMTYREVKSLARKENSKARSSANRTAKSMAAKIEKPITKYVSSDDSMNFHSIPVGRKTSSAVEVESGDGMVLNFEELKQSFGLPSQDVVELFANAVELVITLVGESEMPAGLSETIGKIEFWKVQKLSKKVQGQ